METIIVALLLFLITAVIFIIIKAVNISNLLAVKDSQSQKLEALEAGLQRVELLMREEFRTNRQELGARFEGFQQIFLDTLRLISDNQQKELKTLLDKNSQGLNELTRTLEEKLNRLTEKYDAGNKENREELARNMVFIGDQVKNKLEEGASLQRQQQEQNLSQLQLMQTKLDTQLQQLSDQFGRNNTEMRENMQKSLREFQLSFTNNVKDFNDLQKQKFADLEKKQEEMIRSTETRLEQMRMTVDEKLQKTLETRLGQSFELVSKQLESVQKGLGEMQTLANDVGGLKRVLSNVKTRGVMGEIQLGNILEQILAPGQYDTNVKTKRASADLVEFAIKLPGRDDNNQQVYLPIDAKFPQEAYHMLQTAYDEANASKAEDANRALVVSIRKFAKDIRDKYLDPPYTTDFAMMFLPIEGLYAEVVRNTDLVEQLQREFKVIITGPTTLAAILNSLQMGFRTLAIQQRSSEVWQILGAVKTEFNKFGGILEKARKKIDEAGNDIDNLVGTRTRAIERKLRQVQELPASESGLLLESESLDEDE